MPRKPKPWWRKDRGAWFVQINRKRYNLGPDKKAATLRYHQLMAEPQKRTLPSSSVVVIIDEFLDWCQREREPTLQHHAERWTHCGFGRRTKTWR
jgi:hypothetical protein